MGFEDRKLGFFEQCGVLCVALVSLLAAFQLMIQLRDILEPLIFSGFVVAAIEKPVEHVYQFLTSCHLCPCARRRQRAINSGSEEEGQARPLLMSRQSGSTNDLGDESVEARSRAFQFVEETVQCDGFLRIVAVLSVLAAVSLGFMGLGVIVW